MQWVGVLCMLVICVVVICGSASSSPAQQRVMVESHRRSAQGPLAVVAEKPRVLSAEPIVDGSAATVDGTDDLDVLVGVITNPTNFERRTMLRDFGAQPGVADSAARVEYVVGDSYYVNPPTAAVQQKVADEAKRHGDLVFVQAREALPHVGKATEKSAAWWLSAPLRSRAKFFCKTDDDSLVHLSHLRTSLLASLAQTPTEHVLYSYVRWRGWLPGHRFQACGGGWGGPADAIHHIEDPSGHCELAEGPFPQGTGTLTCLSRALALRLAQLEEFRQFYQVARARNDLGTPCKTADECAQQSVSTHMWHHEDAGISYNVWRAVLRGGIKAALVHLPEKGWIWPWYHDEIREKQGSPRGLLKRPSRGIIMHKITPDLYPKVKASWRLAEPPPRTIVDCSQRCSQWGWQYARRPCEPPPVLPNAGPGEWHGFAPPWNGSICKFDPSLTWSCCFLRAPDDK